MLTTQHYHAASAKAASSACSWLVMATAVNGCNSDHAVQCTRVHSSLAMSTSFRGFETIFSKSYSVCVHDRTLPARSAMIKNENSTSLCQYSPKGQFCFSRKPCLRMRQSLAPSSTFRTLGLSCCQGDIRQVSWLLRFPFGASDISSSIYRLCCANDADNCIVDKHS